jgi:hypothetical protein
MSIQLMSLLFLIYSIGRRVLMYNGIRHAKPEFKSIFLSG